MLTSSDYRSEDDEIDTLWLSLCLAFLYQVLFRFFSTAQQRRVFTQEQSFHGWTVTLCIAKGGLCAKFFSLLFFTSVPSTLARLSWLLLSWISLCLHLALLTCKSRFAFLTIRFYRATPFCRETVSAPVSARPEHSANLSSDLLIDYAGSPSQPCPTNSIDKDD
jgi:hypothetical protein